MLTLAWRNIWRNKRRTVITSASVFFAVFLAILMRGFHIGAWDSLIDNVLHSYVGYVQIHKEKYWAEKSLDYTLTWNDSLELATSANKDIKGIVPRLESFALASVGTKTKGVMVSGVLPSRENQYSNLSNKLVQGSFINDSSKGLLVAERLAKYLKVSVYDTIVLLSQGYQGVSASALFVVEGIVKLPAPEYDNMTIFMPLKLAQEFYAAPGMLTSVVVDLKNPQRMEKVVKVIKSRLPDASYEVMTWKEMLTELHQMYISDTAGGVIMISILYLIVGFGVFGTVLMMTAERRREFGIMIALGMRRGKVARLVATEMLYIGFIGIIAGTIISLPIVVYFHYNPIEFTGDYAQTMEVYGMEPTLPMAMHADYIINQAVAVTALVLIAVSYPILSLNRLNLVKAIRR